MSTSCETVVAIGKDICNTNNQLLKSYNVSLANMAKKATSPPVHPDKLKIPYFVKTRLVAGLKPVKSDAVLISTADWTIMDLDEATIDGVRVKHCVPLEDVHNALVKADIPHLIYSSHSHMQKGTEKSKGVFSNPGAGPRGRLVVPVRHSKDQHQGVHDQLLKAINDNLETGELHSNARGWSHGHFFPAIAYPAAPRESYSHKVDDVWKPKHISAAISPITKSSRSPKSKLTFTADQELERLRLEVALEFLEDAEDYDNWMLVGAALHYAESFGELAKGAGLALWHRWSEDSHNYDAAALDKKWSSGFSEEGGSSGKARTPGSIYHLARVAGWTGQAMSVEAADLLLQELQIATGCPLEKMFQAKYQAALHILDTQAPSKLMVLKRQFVPGRVAPTEWTKLLKTAEKAAAATTDDLFGSHSKLADYVIAAQEHDYPEGVVAADGQFYFCSGALWQPVSLKAMSTHTVPGLSPDGSSLCCRVSDYQSIATLALERLLQPEFFDQAPIGAVYGDQFFTVEEGKVVQKPLTSEMHQRCAMDQCPDPTPPEKWLAYLDMVFDGPGKNEQIALLQEIMGAVVTGKTGLQTAVMLQGQAKSGKSGLLEVFKALVPAGFCSTIAPHRFERDDYKAKLAGMRLNLCGEVDNATKIPAADFKAIVGGDTVTGRWLHDAVFDFVPGAIHVYAGNKYPKFTGSTEGVWRRWRILHCNNDILKSVKSLVPNYVKNEILGYELGQIVYWAMEGAARLETNAWQWTSSPVHDAQLGQWQSTLSSFDGWLNYSGVELLPDGQQTGDAWNECTPQAAVYQHYVEYCHEYQLAPESPQKFHRFLREDISGTATHRGRNRVGTWCYFGIELPSDAASYANEPVEQFDKWAED